MASSRYTKGKSIGKGSFGTVFLATSAGTGETVVLKEVNLRGLSGKDLKASMAEVDVLKKLKHPHTVAYRDSYRTAGMLCIVMEHAAGGDLGALIERRAKQKARFGEAELLSYMSQLVGALAYCHSELHLLHRDIKPEVPCEIGGRPAESLVADALTLANAPPNSDQCPHCVESPPASSQCPHRGQPAPGAQNIFITGDGQLKLGDFGISRIMASTMALAHTQCGTPLFMSPELASGKPYDAGADAWALGCVLYSLMSLKLPWSDRVKPRAGMMELMRLSTLRPLSPAQRAADAGEREGEPRHIPAASPALWLPHQRCRCLTSVAVASPALPLPYCHTNTASWQPCNHLLACPRRLACCVCSLPRVPACPHALRTHVTCTHAHAM